MNYETKVLCYYPHKCRAGFWGSEIAATMHDAMRKIFMDSLDRWYEIEERKEHPKPPTVEISLEDAKNVCNALFMNNYKHLNGILKEAISKAEGKDTPKDNILIVDVHAREEIKSLKDTISQLQRVIEGMKGKSI